MRPKATGVLQASQVRICNFALLIIFSCLLTAIVVSSFFVKNIVRRVYGVLRGVTSLAQGDLSVTVDDCGQDELGDLTGAFNEVNRNLGEIIAGIKEAAAASHSPHSLLGGQALLSVLECDEEVPRVLRHRMGVVVWSGHGRAAKRRRQCTTMNASSAV